MRNILDRTKGIHRLTGHVAHDHARTLRPDYRAILAHIALFLADRQRAALYKCITDQRFIVALIVGVRDIHEAFANQFCCGIAEHFAKPFVHERETAFAVDLG